MKLLKDTRPIFIAGCGRSGTTFLRFLLSSNDEIFIPNECGFMPDYLKYGQFLPKKLRGKLLFNEPQLKLWYKHGSFEIVDIGHAIKKIHEANTIQTKCMCWGQKTPKFVRHMELFNKCLGDIKWILIYRDPRAVVSSLLKSERHTYSITQAVKRWKKDNKVIIDLMGNYQGKNILIVKYENLINNFNKESRRIFDDIGLKMVNLETLKQKGPPDEYIDGGKLKNITVNQTFIPHADIVDKWKNYLTDKQIRYIEDECGDEMRIFNYSTCFGRQGQKCRYSVNIFSQSLLGYFKNIRILIVYLKKWPILPIYMLVRRTLLYSFYYAKKII